jgi:hypothetical protein
LFGKTRRERDGCDIGAIETGEQVFTPSDGSLVNSVLAVRKSTEGARKREKERYHSKEYIGEHTQ